MLTSTLARITNGPQYCTGALVSPQHVLTCAHFFREEKFTTFIWVAGKRLVYKEKYPFPGTDVVLLTLPTKLKVDPATLPTTAPAPRLGTLTATFGLGGTRRQDNTFRVRLGRYVSPMPVAYSRTRETRVERGGLVFNVNAAVKGDSGGPVYAGGKIIGVQSMITDPMGFNLHFATISLVDHLGIDTMIAL